MSLDTLVLTHRHRERAHKPILCSMKRNKFSKKSTVCAQWLSNCQECGVFLFLFFLPFFFLCDIEMKIKIDSDYRALHTFTQYDGQINGTLEKLNRTKIIIFIIKFSLIAKPCELKRFHTQSFYYNITFYL